MTESYFSQGNAHFRNGEYRKAVAFYQEAIKKEPEFHHYSKNLGKALHELKKVSEARVAERQKKKRRRQAIQRQRKKHETTINAIRTKLLSLGLTDQALAELKKIANQSGSAFARGIAARELTLWHMRTKTDVDYRIALDWIACARSDVRDLTFRCKLSTVELLCHYHLNDHVAGLAAYDRAALAGESTPDLTLARVNFESTPETRVLGINQVLAHYGIEPVTLLPDAGQPAYDRLTCAVDLSKITDGPKVTVLIAAYGAADMLPTALRSLQEQTWANLEIIVLDDCSPTMDTVNVAERFAATDSRIQVVRMSENGGAYVARNHGLDMATGEYVTLHDADDWSHPKKIETQVRFMMENPEVMGCTSEQARCDEMLHFTKLRYKHSFVMFNTSSFLWRHTPVKAELGYWDTVRFGADSEFILRMQVIFGKESLRRIETGPMSFQREAESSVTANPVKGLNDSGLFYGVRKEYREAQVYHHATAKSLKYDGGRMDRPFPVPPMMLMNGPEAYERRFDIVLCADFRDENPDLQHWINRIEAEFAGGKSVGLVSLYAQDHEAATLSPKVRALVHAGKGMMTVYGETVVAKTFEHENNLSIATFTPNLIELPEQHTRRD